MHRVRRQLSLVLLLGVSGCERTTGPGPTVAEVEPPIPAEPSTITPAGEPEEELPEGVPVVPDPTPPDVDFPSPEKYEVNDIDVDDSTTVTGPIGKLGRVFDRIGVDIGCEYYQIYIGEQPIQVTGCRIHSVESKDPSASLVRAAELLPGIIHADIRLQRPHDLTSGLAALPELRALWVEGPSQHTAAAVSPLRHLWTLLLTDTDFDDASVLESMEELRELSLKRSKVEDLTPLQTIRYLQVLDLQGSPATDLGPLARVPTLHTLTLGTVESLEPLRDHPRLASVTLDPTDLDLSPLGSLTELRLLTLCKPPTEAAIRDIGELERLDVLRLPLENIPAEARAQLEGATEATLVDAGDCPFY